jgi:hypothetical protein
MRKKLPPFGGKLEKILSTGKVPIDSVRIFCGFYAWNKCSNFRISYPETCLCLAPWESAFYYRWPVGECDVLVTDTGGSDQEYLEEIIYCLLEANANRIDLFDENFKVTTFKKGIIHGNTEK